MPASSRGAAGQGADRPITVHHLVAAVVALGVVVGGGVARAFFAHRPWVNAIVGGPRLVMFWSAAGVVLYVVDRWVTSRKWYQTSILTRELIKRDEAAR